jgi:hypothetical protein
LRSTQNSIHQTQFIDNELVDFKINSKFAKNSFLIMPVLYSTNSKIIQILPAACWRWALRSPSLACCPPPAGARLLPRPA